MENVHLNWAAYAVAVVAQMVIGYLWFHPAVMGKMWAQANGKSIEEMKPKNPGLVYGVTMLYTLLNTLFLMVQVVGPGQEDVQYHTVKHGLFHALLFSAMVILPVLGTPALHEGKSRNWMLVQFSYWFVRVSVAMAILSMWR